MEEFLGEWCVAILFLDILVWVQQSANVKRFCVGFFFFEVATRQDHALNITHLNHFLFAYGKIGSNKVEHLKYVSQ